MIVGVFLASLAAGAATHRYLEQPLQRWRRRSGDGAVRRRLTAGLRGYFFAIRASSASAAGRDEAGFCPVTSRPSVSTWGAQSAPLE